MTTNGNISIATAINNAVAALSLNNSIDTPRLDAEVLLCYLLGCERISLIINKDKLLSDAEILSYAKYIERRSNNEPVSYITGTREFMSLDFCVGEGVLIPRPDTEILVEEIIRLYKGKKCRILDLCTGSGAIAVSLAYYLKEAHITAVDKYDVCVETTKTNAKNHRVDDRLNILKADILYNFDIEGQFDCIVSNPPYIRTDVLSTLSDDVKNYEPEYALNGGTDGLIFYRKIVEFASGKLNPGGILAFEIGYDQGESTEEIIKSTDCFKNINIINDLAGLNRVVISEKR